MLLGKCPGTPISDPQTNVIDVHISRLRSEDRKGLRDTCPAYGARRRVHAEGPPLLMTARLPAIFKTTATTAVLALYLLLFALRCRNPCLLHHVAVGSHV